MGTTHYNRLVPYGYAAVTATSSAAGTLTSFITAATAASATRPEPNFAYITVETTDCRFRDDGTAPTATVGQFLPKSLTPWPYDGNLRAIQFISTGAQAIVHCSLYRAGP